jgi:hypothetical protein
MKTFVFILLALLAATGSGFAQNLITVQSADNATFYTNLDTALFYAKNGDDIYLPGGYIKANATTLKIDKTVNIIGVGYNPYTNPATENTVIQSQTIEIMPNVNGGSISGIYAKGNTLQILDTVSNFSINRCLFNYIFIGSTVGNIPPSNISITETVVEFYVQGNIGNYGQGNGPQNVFISNSIIGNLNSSITYSFLGNHLWENLTCKNCLIMGLSQSSSTPILNNIQKSLFENCIIIDYTYNIPGNPTNTFRNCMINIATNVNWDPATNSMYNCIFDQHQNSMFVDPQGFIFNMKNNYRLLDNSPGKNAGTDGTDIGIYGGRFPWKDGGLPANPHIESKFVNGTTDNNGNLNVKIKVAAQER